MKNLKLYLPLIMLMLAQSAFAQRNAISEYFSDYEYDRSNTVVSVSGKMFSLFTNFEVEDAEDQAIIDMMSKLDGLKVISNTNMKDGYAEYRKALSMIPLDEYEELMTVRDEERDMKFLIVEKENRISELLMVSGSRREFFILSIFGDIDLKQIALLSKRMDIDGLEELENLNDN